MSTFYSRPHARGRALIILFIALMYAIYHLHHHHNIVLLISSLDYDVGDRSVKISYYLINNESVTLNAKFDLWF